MEFEPESILIKMSCGLIDTEKRGIDLQVIHTANRWDSASIPSSLALAKASSASVVRLSNLRAKAFQYQAFPLHG